MVGSSSRLLILREVSTGLVQTSPRTQDFLERVGVTGFWFSISRGTCGALEIILFPNLRFPEFRWH